MRYRTWLAASVIAHRIFRNFIARGHPPHPRSPSVVPHEASAKDSLSYSRVYAIGSDDEIKEFFFPVAHLDIHLFTFLTYK